MKLFLIISDVFGMMFFKAYSEEDALEIFKVGIPPNEVAGYTNHPSFKIKEATMELLLEVLPAEGRITDDACF